MLALPVIRLVLLISDMVCIARRVTALSKPVSRCTCAWVFVLGFPICVTSVITVYKYNWNLSETRTFREVKFPNINLISVMVPLSWWPTLCRWV
jgi:hypothetical protein